MQKKWWDSFLHISIGLNNLPESCVHLTNGELSQDLYSKNSAKFEGRCISHNSIFPCTCRLSTTKKTSRKEYSTMQYIHIQPNRISSTIILLRKQFLWAQGAICVRFCSLLAMIINFLFFLQSYKGQCLDFYSNLTKNLLTSDLN